MTMEALAGLVVVVVLVFMAWRTIKQRNGGAGKPSGDSGRKPKVK